MLENETVLTLADAAAKLPKMHGKRPHIATLWRWITYGIRGVRLESRRLGGRFVTSIEALDRFGKALAEASHRVPASTSPRKVERLPTARRKAIDQARRRLEAAGI
jgi:hypothetical protein